MQRIEQWAERLAAYKTLLEVLFLALTMLGGTAFLARTWPYPSAMLKLKATPTTNSNVPDFVAVLRGEFQVGNANKESIRPVSPYMTRPCPVP